MRDGEPCAAGSGYCHSGKCPTHSANCRLLWGPGKCAYSCHPLVVTVLLINMLKVVWWWLHTEMLIVCSRVV